uniref:FPL domain-containing protein n=1 Tax=Acrobeloides nanus TaxID=290746 RepID=A0A914C4R6_9BILA
MFRRSSSLWKPKNIHNVEYLKYLHGILLKNEKITESNKALIIEAIRLITEILIWGDQNDTSVFDFFLERQMFSHFISIMKQSCGSYVNVQLLQTLNILFENIRHETSLYFLLSNNHVNSIIVHGFDFSNEEIMAYYISFLKTLSFKLNSYTIHFFFNEATDEFPLFTEAIKYFDHVESMVRIAVRTLTLNVFRVQDEAMLKFVVAKSKEHFAQLCTAVAHQLIEMDTFVRSAENETSNRDRLLNMIDIHLDYMHYINDIYAIQNTDLNSHLSNALFYYVIAPLLFSSISGFREHSSTILLARVTALFILSHLLLIIHEAKIVETVLTSLFFGDRGDIQSQWARNVEKGLHLERVSLSSKQSTERCFFYAHLNSLVIQTDDHSAFYALLLIYAICQNSGVASDMLEAAQIPSLTNHGKIDSYLMERLSKIIETSGKSQTPLRIITLELCCILVRRLLLAQESEENLKSVEEIARMAQSELVARLKNIIFTEDLFLEMFEDEYYNFEKNELRVNTIACDPALFLPPTSTPLSGIPLSKRSPCGNEERIRQTLHFYFIIRKFVHDLSGEHETMLPLSSKLQPMAEVNDCINLNNSDLLSCTVITNKNEKKSRFLVTDQFQLILVEPDSRKFGWAIVRFVGLLQDTHLTGDANDSRALHIVVEDVKSRANPNAPPLLCAKLVFDDHIRCMAGKQRLAKGRKNSRNFKLNLICELFGIKTEIAQASSPVPPDCSLPNVSTRGIAPGSVRKLNLFPTSPSSRGPESLSNASTPTIPDDPEIHPEPGRIKHV